MSGGVDSSVVAALAARSGAEVIGVTLQLYDHGAAVGRARTCCAGQDIYDAKAVAERLGIAHYVFDYESRFRESVIERFADEYARGRTPIPCVSLQPGGEVHRPARASPAISAPIASPPAIMSAASPGRTGRSCTAPPIRRATRAISCSRRRATSSTTCASRWATCPRPAVREIARELALAVADKPDSQDICFVPDGDYARVVEKVRPEAARAGRDRRPRRAGARRASRPDPFHRRPAPRPRDRRPGRAALRAPARARDAAGSWSGRSARSPSRSARLGAVNWLGEGQSERADRQGPLAGEAGAGALRWRDRPFRDARIWRRRRARRRCSTTATGCSAAAGSRKPCPPRRSSRPDAGRARRE